MTFAAVDAIIARLEKADGIVEKYTRLIVAEMQRLVHVDTGELRDSIEAELSGMAAEITAGKGLNDPHAMTEEYGNATHVAHPYFRVAFERYAADFFNELQALLG